MGYKQLIYENRNEIRAYLKPGLKMVFIAHLIGIHYSTVSRELKRNSGRRGYRLNQAQNNANAKKKKSRKHTHWTTVVKQRVAFYLIQDWSPEQISGQLAFTEDLYIIHETIYQYVWADIQADDDLYQHLRGARKKTFWQNRRSLPNLKIELVLMNNPP